MAKITLRDFYLQNPPSRGQSVKNSKKSEQKTPPLQQEAMEIEQKKSCLSYFKYLLCCCRPCCTPSVEKKLANPVEKRSITCNIKIIPENYLNNIGIDYIFNNIKNSNNKETLVKSNILLFEYPKNNNAELYDIGIKCDEIFEKISSANKKFTESDTMQVWEVCNRPNLLNNISLHDVLTKLYDYNSQCKYEDDKIKVIPILQKDYSFEIYKDPKNQLSIDQNTTKNIKNSIEEELRKNKDIKQINAVLWTGVSHTQNIYDELNKAKFSNLKLNVNVEIPLYTNSQGSLKLYENSHCNYDNTKVNFTSVIELALDKSYPFTIIAINKKTDEITTKIEVDNKEAKAKLKELIKTDKGEMSLDLSNIKDKIIYKSRKVYSLKLDNTDKITTEKLYEEVKQECISGLDAIKIMDQDANISIQPILMEDKDFKIEDSKSENNDSNTEIIHNYMPKKLDNKNNLHVDLDV